MELGTRKPRFKFGRQQIIFEGDMEEGELEIGQVSSMINQIQSAKEIIEDLMSEFEIERIRIKDLEL